MDPSLRAGPQTARSVQQKLIRRRQPGAGAEQTADSETTSTARSARGSGHRCWVAEAFRQGLTRLNAAESALLAALIRCTAGAAHDG